MTFELNPQQVAVSDWTLNGSGSLNLIARAGCGKTYTLIEGVVRTILENGLGDIALMAYNKAAAEDFKYRLKKLAQEDDPRFGDWKLIQAGTVHSFGFGAVRRWANKNVKVEGKKCLWICDELARGDDESVYARESSPITTLVSLAKQSGFGFLVSVQDRKEWFDLALHHAVNDMSDGATLDEIVEASIIVFNKSIEQDRDIIDFDDMILAPLVHNLKLWPKDWVLIDEAQDTNASRRALALKLLKPITGRLVAVGDDRQAIYGFTGADADSLDLIAEELSSATLPLTVTYRCPKAIVKEANRLVPDLTAHESAPDGIVRSIPDTYINLEKATSDFWFEKEQPTAQDAILCRNTKPLVETAYIMLAKGIGCRVEGREIGEGLVKLATRWKRVSTLQQLTEKLEEYRDREVSKWNAKGREDRAQGVEDRVEALIVVSNSLVVDNKTLVTDLIDWIRELFGDTTQGSNVVTLCTIHKSKGREWVRVFLLYKADTLPSKWARKEWQLGQERNLEYVAITRAKEELIYVN